MQLENLTGIKRLRDRIERASSQDTLVLTSSQNLNLDDEETKLICSSIEKNKRIKRVSVQSSLMVSPSGAETITHACLKHPSISKLVLPLWSTVDTPSQKTLTYLKDDLENSMEAHNLQIEKDRLAYEAFKDAYEKKYKYKLPLEIYDKHMLPFLVGINKKLTL